MEIVELGVKIPFDREPPIIVLPNKSVVDLEAVPIVRNILCEYEEYGFVQRVTTIGTYLCYVVADQRNW